jgi:hypothetical protein
VCTESVRQIEKGFKESVLQVKKRVQGVSPAGEKKGFKKSVLQVKKGFKE